MQHVLKYQSLALWWGMWFSNTYYSYGIQFYVHIKNAKSQHDNAMSRSKWPLIILVTLFYQFQHVPLTVMNDVAFLIKHGTEQHKWLGIILYGHQFLHATNSDPCVPLPLWHHLVGTPTPPAPAAWSHIEPALSTEKFKAITHLDMPRTELHN